MYEAAGIRFYYKPMVMFEATPPFLFGREPTLRRMPDGSLLSFVYTGGRTEPAPENVAAMIHSDDDGENWSRPDVIFRHPGRAVWGTEIFTETERPFAVFHSFCYETHYSEIRAYRSFTDDSGRSWSEPENLPGVPHNVVVRQGKRLTGGRWIFPVYWTEEQGNWTGIADCNGNTAQWRFVSGVLISDDCGRSFSLHGYLTAPDMACGNCWEPEIVELSEQDLRIYVRCEAGELLCGDSYDGGLTWAPLYRSGIGNPGTKTVIYKVRERLVMINNRSLKNKENRHHLEIMVSSDRARSWPRRIPLADIPDDGDGMVCYPHGFADDRTERLYLAVDTGRAFYLLKIPYRDLF